MPGSSTSLLQDLYRSIRPPSDLVVAIAWVLFTLGAVWIPVVNQTPLRVLAGLPTVLFIPGYLLIAALFPQNDEIDWIERVALSFGLSIAVVPLIGLVLNYTPWGIRLDPVLISIAGFCLVMAAIATYRRLLIPEEERLVVPLREVLVSAQSELFEQGQAPLDRALSVLLVISIVAAVGTTLFVIAVPKEGEHFTEFYILGAEGKAADYPTAFAPNTSQWVTVGVCNHEYRNVTYTVETHAVNQTYDLSTNTSTIDRMDLLDRYSVTLPHNQTGERRVDFVVPDAGYNKLQFLLFNETVPGDDVIGQARIEASDRDLHIWLKLRSG